MPHHWAKRRHSGSFPGYGIDDLFPESRLGAAFETNTDRAGNSLDYLLELAKVAMPSAVVEHGD